jgi:hypothetical protein
LLIVLLDIPDDPGVWHSGAWAEGALKKLHDDIVAQLPQGGQAAFEQATLAQLSIPRANNVLFVRIASPSEILDADAILAIESLLKRARLARLHAALARDPDRDLDDADEAPVFLLRSQHRNQDVLFQFPKEVGLAARPLDGTPEWYVLGQKDVSPDSQTIDYAHAVVKWLTSCPLGQHDITTLYMKHATADADLRSLLHVVFDLQDQPAERVKAVKAVVGVAQKIGLIKPAPSVYYFTPATFSDFVKQLRAIAQDRGAEALVCTKFKFTPKADASWRATKRYYVEDCKVQLTYFKQVPGGSPDRKGTFGLAKERRA